MTRIDIIDINELTGWATESATYVEGPEKPSFTLEKIMTILRESRYIDVTKVGGLMECAPTEDVGKQKKESYS